MAYKSFDADEFANVNFGETSCIRIAYSLEYDYAAELVYVAMSTFNDKEELIGVDLMDAYPIYYEDGTFDALVAVGDNTILLSELQAGVTKDCFAATLVFGSIAFGKLLTGLLIGAGTICGTAIYKAVEIAVQSGWFTYKTKSLTRAKVESRVKTAIKAKGNNPDVYYLAETYQNKVCILSSPWRMKTASDKIKKYGNSFWTPLKAHAKELAVYVSGGSEGPEIHADKETNAFDGRYYHYHLKNHQQYKNCSIHIWYGNSIGDIY